VGQATGAWCRGGAAASGATDGAFTQPQGIAIDAGGNVYVTDFWRVSRLGPDGGFTGWTGSIQGTIAAGPCAGQTGVTSGWCTGGVPASYDVGSGFGIHLDRGAGVLYVANYHASRIDRFDAATGAYLGWAGEVDVVPTSGDLGCTTAPVGRLTPGWCFGGSARVSDRNGSFGPSAITGAGEDLFIADGANQRIVRLGKTAQ
jgi:DNA-binding beta-propeller fold protein YncE